MALLLIALAIAPAAAIIWFVYTRDVHEKEPINMLILAFGLGILSIIPAYIGYLISGDVFSVSGNPLMTAGYAFGVVALSEEFGKFIFLRYVMFKKKAFNEPYDGIIYAVMISMGFATFENFMYVAEGGFGVGVLRMFTAVPAHAVFGVAMGYYVGLAKFEPQRRNEYLAKGLLWAVILHGAYDFFLMQTNIPALFIFSFIGLYQAIKWARKAIKQHAAISPFKEEEIYDPLQQN